MVGQLTYLFWLATANVSKVEGLVLYYGLGKGCYFICRLLTKAQPVKPK
jgi:hypothetical protein